MTSQRVEKTWISTGGYRWFRGEWVKEVSRCWENALVLYFTGANHAELLITTKWFVWVISTVLTFFSTEPDMGTKTIHLYIQ